MNTQVVNLRREKYDTYIGRGSIWGNPYVIGKDGTRAEVIAMYEEHLRLSGLIDRIRELHGKVLGCYCKPAACHGDILAQYADATVLPARSLSGEVRA